MRGLRSIGLIVLYVGAQLVALALALPFRSAGLQTTSNPNNPADPVFLIAAIVIAPLAILWLVRRRGGFSALRGFILVAIAGSLLYTLYATFSLFFPTPFFLPPVGAGNVADLALVAAALVSVVLFLALLLEPQWYVVDLVGFLAAGSLIALLGISFGILPTVLLLVVLAVYDAIAVYRTKHMVSLAEVVAEMRLPILMVMPSGGGYDYTRAPTIQQQRAQPVEEREAMFMGLGDVVFPGVLVVSAFAWLPTAAIAGWGGNLLVALGALLGSLGGFALLERFVMGGNPQAGLPFLNGGALAGYAVTYLLVFHNFTFGLALSL
jgi:presenilin-like A22 family membrane protease